MSNKTYIGLHPNNLNRTEYGQVVLYVEGEPVAFFSGSGDVVISGSLSIEGITNVSASIAAAISTDTGSFVITGSVNNDTITFTQGDGTTFDIIVNNVTSSLTASYVEIAQTASYVTLAQSASYVELAQSASYVLNAVSASYAISSSYAVSSSYATFTAFAEDAITASYAEFAVLSSTASLAEFALLASTASYIENAQTASYVLNAVSSSYTDYAENAVSASYSTFAETAVTASYVLNAVSASYALTASYVENAISASYVENAVSASYVLNAESASYASFAATAETASYVLNAESASYASFAETAVTASYVLNAESASYASFAETAVTASYTTFAETSTSSSYTDYAENAKNALTASSADSFFVRENLEVLGTVTAREFQTQFVSSSVIYSSGSTKFGDDDNDIHSFSGSVNVTQDVTAVDVNIDDWGSVSASLSSLRATAGATNLQQVTDVGNTTTNDLDLRALTASADILATGNVYGATGSFDYVSVSASLTTGGTADIGSTLTLRSVLNAGSDLDKFLVLDSPNGNVKYRTGAQLASDISANLAVPTLTQVLTAGNTSVLGMSVGRITGSAIRSEAEGYFVGKVTAGGGLVIGTVNVPNAGEDTDKFLVLDSSGNVEYRTGTEVLSDIGALTAASITLDSVTTTGNTTENSIQVGDISGSLLRLSTVLNSGFTADKFLIMMSGSNIVGYRTAAQLRSDIGAATSSLNLQGVTNNGNTTTHPITASALNITTNAEVAGNLTVGGVITAEEFRTEYITQTVIYNSGSTAFGNTADDKHSFTGSINLTGNISSSDSYINDWGSISASLSTLQSSAGVSTLQDVTDNGNTTTLSITASGANLTSVANAGTDTDKFLVLNSNGSIQFRTGDEIASDIGAATQSFDGNRPITQPLLPDLVSYNPGTSDIATFLEQVFYPDPGFGIEILTNEPFYILESELSSSFVRGATVSGTPVGNYYSQYGTASFEANTDVSWSLQTNSVLDIHPNTGELFIKINLSGSATYQAPKTIAGTVTANATSGGYKTRDFTVTVIENTGPSISTTDISNYSPKEASFVTASGAYIGSVYITEQADPKGPPTIGTFGGSHPSLFSSSLTSQAAGATYYNIHTTQALNSGSYELNFTGSDLYGNEASASVTLVINANTAPELTVYSGFDGNITNFSTGDTYGQITVTDNTGDAIDTFTLSGPDASDFTVQRVTSNMGALSVRGQGSGTGTERWAVKFATTPQIGSYNITASATDNFAFTGSLPIVNELAASTPSLPSPNGTFYIIESALSGAEVTTTSTGIVINGSTEATVTTNQPVSWSLADDLSGKLAISGSTVGYITLQGDLSGSSYQNGSILTATVRATNVYDLYRENTITVNVTDNVGPSISLNNLDTDKNNYYTKGASLAGFGYIRVYDDQGIENVQLAEINGAGASYFTTSSTGPAGNAIYYLSSSQEMNSGSYVLQLTASDSYGQFTYNDVTITINPNNPPVITGGPFTVDYSLATDGDTIGSVSVADGDNGVDGIASFTLTGADSSKFTPVLTGTAGNLTKTYNINTTEDLAIGTYNLSGSATDGFGHTVVTAIPVTINAQAPDIPDSNDPFYIIESALANDFVYAGVSQTLNENGYSGNQGQFTTNQTVTWTLTNGTFLDIDSNGRLSAKLNISGSSKTAGSTITDQVNATNGAGTTTSLQFTVTVTDNLSPTITSGLTTSKNNNKTTGSGAEFGTITISDPQGLGNVTLTDFNGPNVGSFSFNPGAVGSTTVYTVTSATALNSGSYSFSVTGSDNFNQLAKSSFTITVVENLPPTLQQTGFTKTTGQATNGATIGTIVASDPQDDSISSFTLSGLSSSKFTAVLDSSTATSKTYNINSTEDLVPGSYNLTASAQDSFGLSVTEPVPTTITAVAPDTPAKSHAQFYIIESATSSVAITGDSSGIPGSLARMTTDQSVSWSLTPPTYLTIDSDGYLSLQANVSGSAKTAGGEIVVDVRATNTFGAYTERTVDVDVTANLAPTLSYTGLTVVSGSTSANGETVGTVTATDTQAVDSISSIAITGGTDAASFALASTATTANSRTYNINTAADLGGGSYQIELTATDSFNKQTVENKTITVTAPAASVEKVYVYGSTRGAASLTSVNAAGVLGDPDLDDAGIIAGSPLEKLKASDIGDATIAVGGGTMTRIHTGSLARLTDLDTFGNLNFSNALQQILILFPSGSSIEGQPVAMYDGTLPASSPQAGRYSLYDNNATIPGVVSSGVHYFDLDAGQSVDGFSRWGLIYSEAANQNNATFHIIPDSGSAP